MWKVQGSIPCISSQFLAWQTNIAVVAELLEAVLEAIIQKAKFKSEDFSELYREIYYGGSYYDKLKVKSTDYEFDLNVVFKQPKSSVHICNLGDDYR